MFIDVMIDGEIRVGLFFFFQAEDGIRDYKVTGVQTCALPILLKILLENGGLMAWLLLGLSAVVIVVLIERLLHYHRAQINSEEFLNGVRNVLKRDNVVEALSICDATPGPVARLVKTAILNRDRGRDGVRDALEESGLLEVPRLEDKLNLLATIAQIAPLMGLLGTVMKFLEMFRNLQLAGPFATPNELAGGNWGALSFMAAGGGGGGPPPFRRQFHRKTRQHPRAPQEEGSPATPSHLRRTH